MWPELYMHTRHGYIQVFRGYQILEHVLVFPEIQNKSNQKLQNSASSKHLHLPMRDVCESCSLYQQNYCQLSVHCNRIKREVDKSKVVLGNCISPYTCNYCTDLAKLSNTACLLMCTVLCCIIICWLSLWFSMHKSELLFTLVLQGVCKLATQCYICTEHACCY